MPKGWEKQFKKSLGGRDFCFYDLLTFSLPSYAAGDYRIHVGSKSGLMPGIVDVNSWITVTRVDATHVRQRLAGNLKFNLYIPGLKQVVERIVVASLGTAYDAIGKKVAPAYFKRREENLRSRGFQGCPSAIYRLHPEVDKYRKLNRTSPRFQNLNGTLIGTFIGRISTRTSARVCATG